ncbi:MAG: hypothetical protein ABJB12_21750 [Pseudomonadota bacterium]
MLSATTTSPPTDPWQSASCASAASQPNLSAACLLLALMVQSQTTTQASSKTDVELDFNKLQELKKQLADAIQQAKDAADHSGFLGFLGDIFGSDIAEIAGAIAAVAAVVATGGAAGPILLVALAEGLEAASRFGPELGIDPKICMALGLASAAIGLCTGAGEVKAASALASGARDVQVTANVSKALATGTGGVLHGVASHYKAKELDFQADATKYRAANDVTTLDFNAALDLLQRALKTEQRETATVSAITQNNADTSVALANRI